MGKSAATDIRRVIEMSDGRMIITTFDIRHRRRYENNNVTVIVYHERRKIRVE